MSFACVPTGARSLARLTAVNEARAGENNSRAREMKWKFLSPFRHKLLHLDARFLSSRIKSRLDSHFKVFVNPRQTAAAAAAVRNLLFVILAKLQ